MWDHAVTEAERSGWLRQGRSVEESFLGSVVEGLALLKKFQRIDTSQTWYKKSLARATAFIVKNVEGL